MVARAQSAHVRPRAQGADGRGHVATAPGAIMVVNHAGQLGPGRGLGLPAVRRPDDRRGAAQARGAATSGSWTYRAVARHGDPARSASPTSSARSRGGSRTGRLVPLLGDRDISRNGVIVDFFGEPASLPGRARPCWACSPGPRSCPSALVRRPARHRLRARRDRRSPRPAPATSGCAPSCRASPTPSRRASASTASTGT